MAQETTKDPKDLSVEEHLHNLYELQAVVSEIDRIRSVRGELPLEVQDLEDEIVGLQTRLEKYTQEITDTEHAINAEKNKIAEARIAINKSTENQNNVRNNREYDALSKAITERELDIQLCEKHLNDFNDNIQLRKDEINELKECMEDRKEALKQKRNELNEIIAETKQQEEQLRDTAKNIETLIEPRLLTAFKRIRKNARNGLAVVTVDRDACGGCFNKIPPQRQLDIKLHKKVIVCEYCGRVLVDKDLASKSILDARRDNGEHVSDPEPQAIKPVEPETQKTTAKKTTTPKTTNKKSTTTKKAKSSKSK